MAEKDLQAVAMADALAEKVRSYGLQKQLAINVGMSDAELSRLLNDQAPKLLRVFAELGLDLVDADFVASLKKVLKVTL